MCVTKPFPWFFSILFLLSTSIDLLAQYMPKEKKVDNQMADHVWIFPSLMTALTFGPDEKLLLVCTRVNSSGLISFDWRTGKFREPANDDPYYDIRVAEIVFSPDNKQVVTTTHKNAQFRDFKTGQLLATVPVVPKVQPNISPDGRILYIPGTIQKPSFSPDGSRLYVPGNSGNVTVWDTKKQEHVCTLTLPRVPENRLTLSPDGKRLAASGKETIQIWNTESLKLTHTIPVLGYNHHLAFRPDSDELIISGPVTEGANEFRNNFGMGVLIVDLKKNKLRTTIPFSEFIYRKSYGLVVSPDGKYAYVTFGSGIGVLDLVNGDRKGFVQDGFKTFQLTLSSDGKTLVCWNHQTIAVYSTEKLLALDPMTPEQVKKAYFPDY